MISFPGLTTIEVRAVSGLATVLALRMFGMFMILPVFSIYGSSLPGGENKTFLGLALGIYGLTQACLQIPMGKFSDQWGRKPVIYAGLIVFAIGSFTAAFAENIYGLMLGRALQGAGAVSAVVMALLSDLTSEKRRTTAMALVGITIGLSFILSIFLGPLLAGLLGVEAIFLVTGLLALLGVGVVKYWVPESKIDNLYLLSKDDLVALLRDGQLFRVNISIFFLHATLISLFLVLPLSFEQHMSMDRHWQLYLLIMVGSLFFMVPAIYFYERRGFQKTTMILGISLISFLSVFLVFAVDSLIMMMIILIVFFGAFNFLEACLPSLASKICPKSARGAALGIYSTFQFGGIFIGATVGGWLSSYFGNSAVFYLGGLMGIMWILCIAGLKIIKQR